MFHTYSIVKTARLNVLLLTITTTTCTVFIIVIVKKSRKQVYSLGFTVYIFYVSQTFRLQLTKCNKIFKLKMAQREIPNSDKSPANISHPISSNC